VLLDTWREQEQAKTLKKVRGIRGGGSDSERERDTQGNEMEYKYIP